MATTARRDGHTMPTPRALLEHLDRTLDAGVTAVDELDDGVLHIGRRTRPDWVMRVFPARSRAAVDGDAAILRWLAEVGFPAERLASSTPVSQIGETPVLITEYVESVLPAKRRETLRDAGGLRQLGELLGTLSALDVPADAASRPGGAWHHLADGHPRDELAAGRSVVAKLADEASAAPRAHLEKVLAAFDAADAGDGLPEAFVHPDFVLANAVATPEPGMVFVDWAGAGRGPRAWPLAFLLWAEAMRNPARVDLVLAGYYRRAALQAEEIERLPGLIRARPLAFVAWGLLADRISPAQAAAEAESIQKQADAVASRVRATLERGARMRRGMSG